ncbi:collagen alpha-1(II) chain-like [Lynx rufus]|uniref:collagen alpha-1(II) chain-like n=1 Tax=Lynx rufus TaxID=61384 RepID=UPI001F124182|nr:collagen alpha-1(II) chain-like [Lynx rufus]
MITLQDVIKSLEACTYMQTNCECHTQVLTVAAGPEHRPGSSQGTPGRQPQPTLTRSPRRPRARRLEATGAQERTARVAEARKLGAPGRWTHRRPRGVGSARLARGHSRCARRVEDDSASLGSVFPGGQREGPPKFPVTAQMSRAGRGLRQLGPGGSGQRGRGGGGGSSGRPGLPRLPFASPLLRRAARKHLRPKGWGSAWGSGWLPGLRRVSPSRNLGGPPVRRDRAPRWLPLPALRVRPRRPPHSRGPRAAARSSASGSEAPARAPGASGAAPLRPEPEPALARQHRPPRPPLSGSAAGGATAGGHAAVPSPGPAEPPVPSPLHSAAGDPGLRREPRRLPHFCLCARPYPPENPLRRRGTRPRRPGPGRPRASPTPTPPPPPPPRCLGRRGRGTAPGPARESRPRRRTAEL